MKNTKRILILILMIGLHNLAFANERSKCIKACNDMKCSSSSPSVCAKEKQDCRNKCPR